MERERGRRVSTDRREDTSPTGRAAGRGLRRESFGGFDYRERSGRSGCFDRPNRRGSDISPQGDGYFGSRSRPDRYPRKRINNNYAGGTSRHDGGAKRCSRQDDAYYRSKSNGRDSRFGYDQRLDRVGTSSMDSSANRPSHEAPRYSERRHSSEGISSYEHPHSGHRTREAHPVILETHEEEGDNSNSQPVLCDTAAAAQTGQADMTPASHTQPCDITQGRQTSPRVTSPEANTSQSDTSHVTQTSSPRLASPGTKMNQSDTSYTIQTSSSRVTSPGTNTSHNDPSVTQASLADIVTEVNTSPSATLEVTHASGDGSAVATYDQDVQKATSPCGFEVRNEALEVAETLMSACVTPEATRVSSDDTPRVPRTSDLITEATIPSADDDTLELFGSTGNDLESLTAPESEVPARKLLLCYPNDLTTSRQSCRCVGEDTSYLEMTPRVVITRPDDDAHKELEEQGLIDPEMVIKHPLQNSWAMWFLKNDKGRDWKDNLRVITTFDTVEDFWGLYNHTLPASKLQSGCDYSVFKDGIQPMWEDVQNKKGGRWLINLNKIQRQTHLDAFWLETLLCLIGEGFDEHSEEICGATVNVRNKGDKLGLWTRDAQKTEATKKIGIKLKESLNVPSKIVIGFQAHSDTAGKAGSTVKNRFTV